MKAVILILAICMGLMPFVEGQPSKSINVKISFFNTINNQPIVLTEETYRNPFGEELTITKLKYYVSGIQLYAAGKAIKKINRYFLINQANEKSCTINLNIPINRYDSIGFLLGVDSARNCSGAQTGALDPLNDMFWTWQSGYVMQKLEGISPQSNLPNHKFEYHLGGYSGSNSVLNFITLPFPGGRPLKTSKSTIRQICINANFSQFWNAGSNIKISETAACTTAGNLAKKMADNFKTIFQITEIKKSSVK